MFIRVCLLFLSMLILFTFPTGIDGVSKVSKLEDAFGRYQLIYPSYWEVLRGDNYDLTFYPVNKTAYENTYFQIKSESLHDISLEQHVFREINHYISKSIIGDFLSFRLTNLVSNLTLDNLPAYMLEYDVIMNDEYQSPVSVSEYFIVNDNELFKLISSNDGYAPEPAIRNATDFIIKSLKFR